MLRVGWEEEEGELRGIGTVGKCDEDEDEVDDDGD